MYSDKLARFATIVFVALLFWGGATHAHAGTVIADDEASAAFIAGRIASSSGTTSEDYDRYSRKLARTLSLLTPEQQARVLSSVNLGGGGDTGGGEGTGEGGTEDTGAGDTDPASGEGDNWGDTAEEEIAAIRAFEEMLMGGGESSWDGTSEPWWWPFFREIFRQWLAGQRSGGGRG